MNTSWRRIFAVPMMLAAATLVAVMSASSGEGLADVIAWIALSVPLATIGWAMARRGD